MPEWDYKDRPDAFCNIPEADVAARISGLIEQVPAAGTDHLRRSGPVPAPRPRAREPCGAGGVRQPAASRPSSTSARCAAATGGRSGRRCANSAPRCPTSRTWTRRHGGRRPSPSSASPPPSTSGRCSARKRDALFAHGSQISGVVVQQDPAGHRRGHLRPRALHPGQRHHRRAAARRRPVRRACGHDRAEAAYAADARGAGRAVRRRVRRPPCPSTRRTTGSSGPRA